MKLLTSITPLWLDALRPRIDTDDDAAVVFYQLEDHLTDWMATVLLLARSCASRSRH